MIDQLKLDKLTEIIQEALEDCSTTDYYEISEGGVHNLSFLAAQALLTNPKALPYLARQS